MTPRRRGRRPAVPRCARDRWMDGRPIVARCLCGAVKLEFPADVRAGQVLGCACSMCRRQSGAAEAWFVGLPRAIADPQVKSCGTLKRRSASDACERIFCGECGSWVGMDYFHEHTLWLTLGIFEDDDAVSGFIAGAPRDSLCFTESAARWASAVHALPRLENFGSFVENPCGPDGGSQSDSAALEAKVHATARS